MLLAMPFPAGRSSRAGVIGKSVRIVGAVSIAAAMGWTMAGRRGPVLGILAFLAYGALLGVGALSFSRLHRWSADHVVLDSLIVVPLAFFALLLIPMLPWWGAALTALATGMIVVPFAVRRRTAQRRLARRH